MADRKLILICQSGGKFMSKKDGSLSYNGGEAHAIDVNSETRLDNLMLELAETWNMDMKTFSVKYLLPTNKSTLITLSNDKDLQRMIDFHGHLVCADIFVVKNESITQNKPTSPTDRVKVSDSAKSTSLSTSTAATTQIVAEASSSNAMGVSTTLLVDSSTAAPIVANSTSIEDPFTTTAGSFVVASTHTNSTSVMDPAAIGASSSILLPTHTNSTSVKDPATIRASSSVVASRHTNSTSVKDPAAIRGSSVKDPAAIIADASTHTNSTSVKDSTAIRANSVKDPATIRADASAHTTGRFTGGVVDNPTSIDNGNVNDVRKKRKTASWKINANGIMICSIDDEVGQQVDNGYTKAGSNGGNGVSSYDDPGHEIPTSFSDNDTNGVMETKKVDRSVSRSNYVGKGQQKLMNSWKNGIASVEQEFKNVNEFRDVLRKFAIANHFNYELEKNDTDHVSAKCTGDGCPWRINASWDECAQAFKVKEFQKSHSSGNSCKYSHHPQSTKHWLVTLVKESLRDSPHTKPKEIVNDICREFGIELNYSQASHGMHMEREHLQGSYKDGYNQLPWFCDKVIETNPGSVAKLITKDDFSFERIFISLHASLHGFENGCRPLIFLDSTSLRSKNLETLLVAVSVDGNDSDFPVAFAIVVVEDDDTWRWFLEQLRSVISSSRSITFVSDKNKGLREKVLKVFENSQYGYCIHHLLEEFMRNTKGPFHGDGKGSLQSNFLAAAHAPRPEGFRKCTQKIKSVSDSAFNWVNNIDPQFWANSEFKGEHYLISLDVLRSINDWILDARNLPMVEKINAIICKLRKLINTQRIDSSKCSSKLSPLREEKLKEETIKSRSHKVYRSSESVFEVHERVSHVVDMDKRECTCRRWKVTGLPCSHAIAVFKNCRKNPYDYCSNYFSSEALRLTYSESINVLPDMEKPVTSESSEKVLVLPPRTRPHNGLGSSGSAGQPMRKRIRIQDSEKKQVPCNKSNGEGDNKAS